MCFSFCILKMLPTNFIAINANGISTKSEARVTEDETNNSFNSSAFIESLNEMFPKNAEMSHNVHHCGNNDGVFTISQFFGSLLVFHISFIALYGLYKFKYGTK